MAENKYQRNEIIYFVHGVRIIKGVIDEIIIHYTQKETIIKYMIRPYGIANYVTIDECQIYQNIEDAKQRAIDELQKTYKKENIVKNYNEAKKNMEKKYKEEMKGFDSNFKKAYENLKNITDEYYDNLEKTYQEEKQKGEKKNG